MVNVVVCGSLWVDYTLDLSVPARHGHDCDITGEVRAAGGRGLLVTRALLAAGHTVALWSNPVGDDSNGRVLRRALESLPDLRILTPALPEIETPYRVTLQAPGVTPAYLWRNRAATRVPLPQSESWSPWPAAIVPRAAEWNLVTAAWRERGTAVLSLDCGTAGGENMADIVEEEVVKAVVSWARELNHKR